MLRKQKQPQCVHDNKRMPILTNQRMNYYLKEIATVCGINKELTFHMQDIHLQLL
jgi:hypothetical protein